MTTATTPSTALTSMKLTLEQQARLIFKSRHEPSRNQKRYLKDLGGSGTSAERDELLEEAESNPAAVEWAERLDAEREHVNKTVAKGTDSRVAEMLASIRSEMIAQGLNQQNIADHCGWDQALVSKYLNGVKEPGIEVLTKMATAMGCVWELKKMP